ncbi:Sir2 histone deacetylase Hst2 [Malassezia pachydermatis]
MGTSLVVQPFASLIDEVPAYCPRALFNLEKVGEGIGPGLFSKWNNLGEEGFDFSTPGTRDIFCQGKVDDTIRALAELCGWKVSWTHAKLNIQDELETLFEEMNTGMDKLHAEEKEDEDDTTHSKDDTDALVEKLAVASINDVESSKEKL